MFTALEVNRHHGSGAPLGVPLYRLFIPIFNGQKYVYRVHQKIRPFLKWN